MKCPNCSWPMPDDDLYCHRCGTDNSPPREEKVFESVLVFEGVSLPAHVRDAFQMLRGEKAVGVWRCRSLDEEQRVAAASKSNAEGLDISALVAYESARIDALLVLTDLRLIFLREGRRLKGLSYTEERTSSLAFVLDLSAVLALEAGDGKVEIKVDRGHGAMGSFVLSKIFRVSPGDIAGSVPLLCDDAKGNLQHLLDHYRDEAAARNRGVQVIVDFSFLKDVLGRGGVLLQSAKCPNCGGVINLPEGGSLVKCDYCGGTLQAVDVLHSIRELLGGIKSD